MEGSERQVPPPADKSDVVRCLDDLVATARAHCGVVVVRSPDGLREIAARSDRRRDLARPIRYARSVCERVFAEGKRVALIDTGGVASRRSVVIGGSLRLDLMWTECTPLRRDHDTIAVVYLETSVDQEPPGESHGVQVAVEALAAAVAGRTADSA